MQIKIKKATEGHYEMIRNFVPYYIYDISEFSGCDCSREGQYDGCNDLPTYWRKEDYHPFLIEAEEKAAGFALVRPYPKEVGRMEIADLFILRKFRGKGIGRRPASQLFGQFPGPWLVRVPSDNQPALGFWDRVIGGLSNGNFDREEDLYQGLHSYPQQMHFFRFQSSALDPDQESTEEAWREDLESLPMAG